MSEWSQYFNNPQWVKFARVGLGEVNGGHARSWPKNGMFSPMFPHSNEYSYTAMKRGSNDAYPYNGGLQHFSDAVDSNLQQQVRECSRRTFNPSGCQQAAVQQVFTKTQNSLASQGHTPHPYGISYVTGAAPNTAYIPPLPRGRTL